MALAPLLLVALDVTVRLHWLSGPGRTVTLPLEEYVAGVIAGEAASLPLEPRKAMAVAARTYAARFRGRHAREGFDFCDTTHCQDYRGAAIEARSWEAVAATTGELLWRNGQLVETYYTRSCLDRWQRVIPVSAIPGTLAPGEYRGPGRLATVRWNGRLVDATAFRFQLGTAELPSNWFDLRRAGNSYVFSGQGQGHGEGLCQLEAARLSLSYREILSRYYPRSEVGLTAAGIRWQHYGGERVDVFATRLPGPLVVWADRALTTAEELSGLRLKTRPRIRFYPTRALFRDATGQSGRVAAFSRGVEIDLQPLPPERLRDTLEHELLHVVLESHGAPGHPWWFREGLVLALRNEQPLDLRYQEAAALVRRLLASHGRQQILHWWIRGLPAQASPSSMNQQPR